MNKNSSICLKGPGGHFQGRVFRAITQPLTATQLSRRLDVSVDRCSKALARLRARKLVRCVSPAATRSRIFWLTESGMDYRLKIDDRTAFPIAVPDLDWDLYATLCFSHRSVVVRTLSVPMQPAQIKRRAASRMPGVRMSANNVRDVIRYLKTHGLVHPVLFKAKGHPRYELTSLGLKMRRLLLQAEVRV